MANRSVPASGAARAWFAFVPRLAALAVVLSLAACSNIEVPDLDADVRREQIIPADWKPLPLRVGLAPFRMALELDEARYNVEDTRRWVLTPENAELEALHSQLLETFRRYESFEHIQAVDGVGPESSREDVQAAALRQGLDIVMVPTLRRRDIGYVDSNGAYGWNMFVWWMVSPIFSWWIADEDFDANLHVDLRVYPTTRDTELISARLQPPQTIVRSLDDWDEGFNLFSIFSTPNHFDESNWQKIGGLLLPIAENEAQKAALRFATGELAEASRTETFKAGIRRRVALVVGVDGTGRAPLSLTRYAQQDAQAVAAHLLEASVNNVPEGSLRSIIGPRATRRAVTSAASELATLARGNDDVILWFSGLGTLDANAKPSLVLAQPPGATGIEMLALEDLIDALTVNRPRTLTLMLDCSFAAAGDRRCAATAEQIEGLDPQRLFEGIIQRCAARGTECVILAAAGGTMPALEIEDLGHGLFTSFALEALSGAADANRDRRITAAEFSAYVGERVSHIAGLEGTKQAGHFRIPATQSGFVLPTWHR